MTKNYILILKVSCLLLLNHVSQTLANKDTNSLRLLSDEPELKITNFFQLKKQDGRLNIANNDTTMLRRNLQEDIITDLISMKWVVVGAAVLGLSWLAMNT